eukprot:GHUV01010165.1.p2 GENE.GHUV01010165.1~~GHUV01010165.1.p2  ORF type:complete len:101 (-),score=0.65 GHUV01010165.1:416-718(-)
MHVFGYMNSWVSGLVSAMTRQFCFRAMWLNHSSIAPDAVCFVNPCASFAGLVAPANIGRLHCVAFVTRGWSPIFVVRGCVYWDISPRYAPQPPGVPRSPK